MAEAPGDPYPQASYTYQPAMLVVGPCLKCGRKFVVVGPRDREPIPLTCRECD